MRGIVAPSAATGENLDTRGGIKMKTMLVFSTILTLSLPCFAEGPFPDASSTPVYGFEKPGSAYQVPMPESPIYERDYTAMHLQNMMERNNLMYAEILARQRMAFSPDGGNSESLDYNVTDNTDYDAKAKALYAEAALEAVKGYDGDIISDVISLPFKIIGQLVGALTGK